MKKKEQRWKKNDCKSDTSGKFVKMHEMIQNNEAELGNYKVSGTQKKNSKYVMHSQLPGTSI